MKLLDKNSDVKFLISLTSIEVRDVVSALRCLKSNMFGTECFVKRIDLLLEEFTELK